MTSVDWIGMASIVTAGITIALGGPLTAIGEGWALSRAMNALAQQPDAAPIITRTLFVGIAMLETGAIYCFVVSMILIFANPFWNHVIGPATGGQ